MKLLRVVHIAIVLILYFQNYVEATCPNLTNISKNLNIINRNETFYLYQFTSADERVQSPFSSVEGDNKFTKLEDLNIKSFCYGPFETKLNYNFAKLINFDNQTGKIKLEYRNDILDLSCHTKFKMTDIFLVDYKSRSFVSLYSCLMETINGRPTKFEGVYIFVDYLIPYQSKTFRDNVRPALLNNTYKFLESQTNILMDSLKKTDNANFARSIRQICNDIIELSDNCTTNALIKGNERFITWRGILVKIFCCIGVIFIILIGKHVLILLVKFNKRFNRVVPLTEGRS